MKRTFKKRNTLMFCKKKSRPRFLTSFFIDQESLALAGGFFTTEPPEKA